MRERAFSERKPIPFEEELHHVEPYLNLEKLRYGEKLQVVYKKYEFTLEKGGTLFLYADGVAEATDGQKEQFGMDRILEVLNREPDAAPRRILETMQSAVEDFVGDAPQFDDLTMMALEIL